MNPLNEILQRALDAEKRADELTAICNKREQKLEAEYRAKLKADKVVTETSAQAREWHKLYTDTITELFIPGTIVRSNDYITSGLYVVDKESFSSIYLGARKVVVPFRMNKQTNYVRVDNLEIVQLADIDDPRIRTSAEKLIAKIRLKDW